MKQLTLSSYKTASMAICACLMTVLALAPSIQSTAYAEQPPPPCHPNPNAAQDRATVAGRGDVVNLPTPLKDRLVQMADRPHSFLPIQVFAQPPQCTQLFPY